MKLRIELELDKCADYQSGVICPYHDTVRTEGAGYALDHVCTKMNDRITSGYVEWDRDINPIPDWCPILVK